MPAKLIDGKALAAQVRASLRGGVAALAARGVQPCLAAILAGDDPASRVYVRNKARACEQTGLRSDVHEFPGSASESALIERVQRLNADPGVHGIVVQLPLPPGLDPVRVVGAVSPWKDVDGFHDANLGALLQGRPRFVPGTPAGVMRMLEHAAVPVAGARAVVVGRSVIVGKPLALLLLQKDATVTICHSRTPELAAVARQADILVAAAGRAGLVTEEMVKRGACVIDVGINRLPDGGLAGDVDFEPVRRIAGWISPVPGGVGPMTVAMLMVNTVRAAELSLERR